MRLFLQRACTFCLFGLLAGGCAYYSFTGASIPPHLSTIAIPLVEDQSTSPLTTMGETMTQLLIERFVDQTRLSLEPDEQDANVILTARIERYVNEPAAVSAEERAALNRVLISVSVNYFDQVENKELLQRSFTGSAEYNPQTERLEGETTAAGVALENIADDIFTAATSNW